MFTASRNLCLLFGVMDQNTAMIVNLNCNIEDKQTNKKELNKMFLRAEGKCSWVIIAFGLIPLSHSIVYCSYKDIDISHF